MPTGKPKLSKAEAEAIKQKQKEAVENTLAYDLDTKFVILNSLLSSLNEVEGYQRKKVAGSVYGSVDEGMKGMLMDLLIDHWAASLPKKAKEYGVDEDNKIAKKIEWLEEHWGTAFTSSSGKTALRKMPTAQVIELLLTFLLNGCVAGDEDLTFGSLDDGSDLSEKVASALDTMKDAVGEEVVITRAAYNELQRLRKMMRNMDPTALRQVDTKLVTSLQTVLKSMPAAKTAEEIAQAEAKKAEAEAKKAEKEASN